MRAELERVEGGRIIASYRLMTREWMSLWRCVGHIDRFAQQLG